VLFRSSTDQVLESKLGHLLQTWQARMSLKGGLLRIVPYTIEVQ
jgi:hypothetical protein